MKHFFSIFPVLLLLFSCSSHTGIMTYNVGVFSKYSDNSLRAVADAVETSGASLVSLNELDSCNRRHGTYQLQEFARALGWDYAYGSAFPFAGGSYGNGIVSREPVLSRSVIPLPRGGGYEPRSVVVVETRKAVMASTHLDVKSEEAALAQARLINDWFSAHYYGARKPVFLCGDMNATPESPVIAELEKSWERLSGTDPTYPAGPDTTAQRCIDYIFRLKSARAVKVRRVTVLREGLETASDHYPLYVEVKF